MSAREIIADMLARHDGRKYVFGQDHDLADTIVEQLTAAGYRILAPGEVDAETVERCATVLDKGVYASKHDVELAWELAGLIRTLGGRA